MPFPLQFSTSVTNPFSTSADQNFYYDGEKWLRIPDSRGVVATAIAGGPVFGFRNAVTNGDFRIHQRGTASVTTSGSYVVDRWFVSSVNGSRTAQRVSLADSDRTTIGTEEARFALQYAATGGAAATDYEILAHRIENAGTFGSRWTTLSFWARRTAGTGNITTESAQSYPGGSGDTLVAATRHTLTTSWQKFTHTFWHPTVMGQSNGTSASFTQIAFWLSAGANFSARAAGLGVQTVTVQIAEVQWEVGNVATNFERRHITAETMLCQRYACVIEHNIQAYDASNNYLYPFFFPVRMAATPSTTNLVAGTATNATLVTEAARDVYGGYFQITPSAAGGSYIGRRTLYQAEL